MRGVREADFNDMTNSRVGLVGGRWGGKNEKIIFLQWREKGYKIGGKAASYLGFRHRRQMSRVNATTAGVPGITTIAIATANMRRRHSSWTIPSVKGQSSNQPRNWIAQPVMRAGRKR